MTTQERAMKIESNRRKYGLSAQEIKAIRVPKASVTKSGQSDPVLTLEQIFHPKSNFSIIEKINHLENLKQAIVRKVKRMDARRLQN